MEPLTLGLGAAGLLLVAVGIALAFAWRTVVPTNLVHIVQSSKKTTSYGAGSDAGNTYYDIPSAVPIFGVTRLVLPVNNFSIFLEAYDAYDKDRLPFELDLMGFFVVNDTNKAAAKVASFSELEKQLEAIMQGAARTVLAQHDIHEIMGDRAKFGEAFTAEVDEGLSAWGVKAVKSLELMDIRDVEGSKVISNIMAKKSSEIEMESRTVVAENKKQATVAEIEAQQIVDIRRQEQAQAVGERTATADKQVAIAKEMAMQDVQTQAKITKEREMDVLKVATVRQAEIKRDAAVVLAMQEQQTEIINAEANRQVQVKEAEGRKDAMILNADGIRAEGEAKGAAEQAILMAPVSAQIALADKIAESAAYQAYLVEIRKVEASERIGVENAKALNHADLRVIATAGDAQSGIKSIGDVISARGGTQLGALIEGFAQTDAGAAVLRTLNVAQPESGGNGKLRP